MAKQEHERFMDEKIRTDLLPWVELPDEIKEYDRNAVRVIPEFMAMAGLEIYRMKSKFDTLCIRVIE